VEEECSAHNAAAVLSGGPADKENMVPSPDELESMMSAVPREMSLVSSDSAYWPEDADAAAGQGQTAT
jgi:hypothetical protein